jgi:protoheme IX farnesyltransferase
MTNAAVGHQTYAASAADYIALLKPRVMSLVVFTALVGYMVAPGQGDPVLGFAAILSIAVAAGAAGALNMWFDADIDAVMSRTRMRPIPAGRVPREEALMLGLVLSGLSVMTMLLAGGLLAAALLAFTIFFYAVVYSIWLKRATPQNIVIGGAAGAFPPMIGWVAATGSVSVEAALMFALIFMWTPPHFWALALFMKDDYHTAGVPMLTVTHGREATRRQILAYTLLLVPVALGAAVTSIGGPLTLTVALGLNLWFVVGALRIWRRDEVMAEADNYSVEKAFFRVSLLYLFLHFAAFLAVAAL